MKIRLTITALLLFLSCTAYGDQKVDLDSPEGWAMAFMTASAQNLGQVPPHSVDVGDISISAELSSVPRLTGEQQRKRLSVHNLACEHAIYTVFQSNF